MYKIKTRRPVPPLGLHVVALVALLHLPHRQVRVQPVQLLWLQVLQQEAVAAGVLDVGSQPAADQDRADDGLKTAEAPFSRTSSLCIATDNTLSFFVLPLAAHTKKIIWTLIRDL